MTDTKVFLVVFTTSAVTAVIAKILDYLTHTPGGTRIFEYTYVAAAFTVIGSVIIWCIYGGITAPADARKFQAEVDEHKENLAKGGIVPPVRAAVHNAVLIDRKFEEMTDEPAPKFWGY